MAVVLGSGYKSRVRLQVRIQAQLDLPEVPLQTSWGSSVPPLLCPLMLRYWGYDLASSRNPAILLCSALSTSPFSLISSEQGEETQVSQIEYLRKGLWQCHALMPACKRSGRRGKMPQVVMGERAPQGYWGQDKEQAVIGMGEETSCREGSLRHLVI